ncbi:O-GlcNAcase NagJ precursor [Streptomyces sp. YIM 130001]|uniref:beta-N-acetylglucosaminidase domain-containing protein n=1 Tax=Streptomyces sp. YIM 130001 TaxID=2259644 RepID=UPI000E652A67|nr:beta-N-acetylglucosaminidase domain-containing protein [Streptomyces sp. YIM 130001]RII19503.1 O-GlcNAcase NagJ precursor [Streptomyces sp. YIM 130001]
MQLRRSKGAAAVVAAVIGGLLGGAPGALAAPQDPAGSALGSEDREDNAALPSVWPRPQNLQPSGAAVPIGSAVALLTDENTDPYAVQALRTLLREAGARQITEVPAGAAPPADGLLVRAGQAAGGRSGASRALGAMRAPERGDLPSGGYRLAVGRHGGRDTVALEGAGPDGLFHGVQTLRQVTSGGQVAGVKVRDWPGTAVRGMTEGFYGTPWTREQRLAQLDFMGRTKQNRYLYAPGDDPFRTARWREPYPAEQRADFRALTKQAAANHVTFAWAVSPGQTMCMSSKEDMQALTRKVDAMWALGVRAFQLQFQDVSYSEWHCGQDAETFGSGPDAAARAHAQVANAVAAHLAERHAGAEPLTLMPTEYYQDGKTEYRTSLAEDLDGRVQVAWTGVGVVPKTITGGELEGAREAFGHSLVTMDNYPVNDYAQDRLFLGPYRGREPAVAAGSAALLANAMEQPAASRIPLFTAADYAWNPKAYRPGESWQAAIDDLADGDASRLPAVRALAGNHASSVLGTNESAYLRPLVDAFFAVRPSGDRQRTAQAARALRAAFTAMREAPQRLAATELADEAGPWLAQLSRYGRAGEQAVDLLEAQADGDGAKAWSGARSLDTLREDLKSSRVTVGKDVLDPFLDRVQKTAAAWTGASDAPDRVNEERGSYTVRLPRPRPLEAVTVLADPAERSGFLQAHVPGQGWRNVGRLSGGGWTETGTDGLSADALRVVGEGATGRSGPPEGRQRGSSVRHIVPWYADAERAGLSLDRSETDAQIGGPAERVTARLASRRPAEVRGKVTAKAPKGVEARVPEGIRVPRGATVEVPVDVRIPEDTPAGSYRVPVSFGDETRTLTVRAFPRTGGPDLARGAQAASSGDETPDFPAAKANDGDSGTRWSSPVEDGAWWQMELAEPVRLGRVVLNWQDAHASRYRVQVSANGHSWRDAATVTDSRGGRESVRMDQRDVRFVRVQGDERATRFGYSLWSVEAYAVTADR